MFVISVFFLCVIIEYLFFGGEMYVFLILPCFFDKVARCVVLDASGLFDDCLLYFFVLSFMCMIARDSCFFLCLFIQFLFYFGEVCVFLFFLFVGDVVGGGVLAVTGFFGDCLLCFFL